MNRDAGFLLALCSAMGLVMLLGALALSLTACPIGRPTDEPTSDDGAQDDDGGETTARGEAEAESVPAPEPK